MRLDMFLKISRLVPRRSVAQELCDAGLVSVNGGIAKSSKELKPGDTVEIKRRSRLTKIEVLKIPSSKQVSKNAAGELYRLLDEVVIEDEA
jgi:ribosomal 50S subunit-recycling heat shock protein